MGLDDLGRSVLLGMADVMIERGLEGFDAVKERRNGRMSLIKSLIFDKIPNF